MICKRNRGGLTTLPYAFVTFYVGILLLFSQSVDSTLTHALVTGSEGLIVGEVVEEAAIFLGIPYSQPPIGDLRWKRPTNPTPYESNLWNATYARPECVQTCDPTLEKYICAPIMSEDCLYLNIWIPYRLLKVSNKSKDFPHTHYTVDERFTKNDSESLAVMFYLHGGNYIMGSGSAVLYDGRFLASRQDVIVVTINYRLHVIGFLAQQDFKDSNFGIWDQIQAIEWVRSNIASFGGNINKITIVGQSSGAESVGILMTSPYGKDLFQQAAMHSNPWSLPYRTLPEAQQLGDKVAEGVGCQSGNITCLKSKSAIDLLHAAGKVGGFGLGKGVKLLVAFQPWGPVVDGDLIPELPISLFLEGKFHDVPLILGDDKDEGYLFILGAFTKPVGKIVYSAILNAIGGKLGTSVADDYPPCSSCDNRNEMSKIATDYAFMCPARRVAFQMGNNTWGYVFNATMPWKRIYSNFGCIKEVCHGSEIPYLFDTVPLTDLRPFDTQEVVLSHTVQRYWANFIKYGDPNGKDGGGDGPALEYWKMFSHGRGKSYNVLDMSKQGTTLLENGLNKVCDFWDSLNAYGKY